MAKQDDYTRYTIRIPSELYIRIAAHADFNERSVNGEITSLLELAIWDADMSRIQSGLLPLREATPDELRMVEEARLAMKKRALMPGHTEHVPSGDVPFFHDDLSIADEIASLERKLKDVVAGLQRMRSVTDPSHADAKSEALGTPQLALNLDDPSHLDVKVAKRLVEEVTNKTFLLGVQDDPRRDVALLDKIAVDWLRRRSTGAPALKDPPRALDLGSDPKEE
ncbi:hypothetical protein DTW90_34525 [Neorhizobium sp. P12A]|uniref:hypothetical protein n=1 Tax=Neorhizobium sp. P12A TaxID=2268027 RepID=UPI0011EFE47A|nr:hypothetical protein [Neorhizobium sp. P12A]KAA0686004.1 hypothetical protein DTW90_34525 [Neorhizobium sp. P12A]